MDLFKFMKFIKEDFRPIFFDLFQKKGYSFLFLRSDIIAAFTVAILSLPLIISYSISSGVSPIQGIIAAIIAGIIGSVFGGNRYQISGPTGSFIVLIITITSSHGYSGLVTATFMASIFLIIFGYLKLGNAIKFIPYPVIFGFTSSIAIAIMINQFPHFLGLNLNITSQNILTKIFNYFINIKKINFFSLFIGMSSIFIMIFSKRKNLKIPSALLTLVVTTLITFIFRLPITTIANTSNDLSFFIPSFQMPNFNLDLMIELISPAFSIALLAAIESLLCASVCDGMTESKHKPNIELISQGLSNLACSLFMGIPTMSGLTRTSASIKYGAKSPISSIFQSMFILIISIFFAKFIKYIPLAALSGILFVMAYNMCEWKVFLTLFKNPKSDIAVLITTFILGVFFSITLAIQVGVVLSALLFVSKMSKISYGRFNFEKNENDIKNDPWSILLREVPSEIEIFEIQGPFFIAAVEKFKSTIIRINKKPKVLILRLRNVPFLDLTSLRFLEDIQQNLQKLDIKLVLSGINETNLLYMMKYGFYKKIGKNNIFSNIDEALKYAKSQLIQNSDNLNALKEENIST
jgi:SulP family sulfate permease